MTRYAIGIDLGTTQSALAYKPLSGDAPVELLKLPQLVAASTVEERSTLPSFLYLATGDEAAAGVCDLPWVGERHFATGEWARKQSADVPKRTVAAAKSWLCHSLVDRHAAILPWQAPEEVPKVSPVEVSRRYLEHLAAAWNAAFPDAPLAEQQVVLTVPASFDASARELTREAALAAGFPQGEAGEGFLLLEEPQAAVYAWLAERGETWRRDLREGDRILVTDVGGGTTDFSLIGVESRDGELALRRIAVGNHILVGGDNMDLTLAHLARTALSEKGVEVDAWQAVGLWHACRQAKEALLGDAGPPVRPVTVLGRGRRLIGAAVSVDLERARVLRTLLDGFFPFCGAGERPARRRMSGFREIGLPFENDTAISRHLAAFLGAQADEQERAPTRLLFNGGVFKAPALRERLIEVMTSWYGSGAPRSLEGHHDLDFAVARGAACYAHAKVSGGVRIRGGTARSYYVAVETAGLAVPGAPRPLAAVCVVPKGMEEGTSVDVPGGEVGLVVGETVPFRFFSSTVREADQPGDVLEHWSDDELVETDSLEASLPPSEEGADAFVPVRLRSRLTELGLFELWCLAVSGEGRWKMEFSVREDAQHEEDR